MVTGRTQIWVPLALGLALLLSACANRNAVNHPPTATVSAIAPSPVDAAATEWRALSRLAYGPSVGLQTSLRTAGGAQAWAVQQINAAYAASQQPPRLAAEWPQLADSLPQIAAGAQRDRQARQSAKNADAGKADMREPGRLAMVDADGLGYIRAQAQQAGAWHLEACSNPELENPLLARMTEFWFNHFNVFAGKGAVRPFVGHYLLHAIRPHALGRFEDLLLASARHPAMLLYLDQAQSVADGTPDGKGGTRGLNENYAREVMELHTLGVDGGYSQRDVRELARVLTGWTVDRRRGDGFRFAPRLHDHGPKEVLALHLPGGARADVGEQEGVAALRMLARQPATAHHLSLKLARFFVSDHPSQQLVQALEQRYLASNGDIRAVLSTLVQRPEFWQSGNTLFKTPLDFACSALTATRAPGSAPLPPRTLLLTAGFLANAGQPLHGWQTPDGYAMDAATWMAPEALTRRADYALVLGRQSPELTLLQPYLSDRTNQQLQREPLAARAGLALASPDFMTK